MQKLINVRSIPSRQSDVMHFLRAVSALLVVLEHCKNRVYGPDMDFIDFGFMGVVPRVFFNLGHEAVIVFFVLSGFLVGRKMFQVEDGEDAVKYIIERISRIYVVAIPALVLSAAVSIALMYSIGVSYSQPNQPSTCSPSASDLIGNLILLNKVIIPTICSNSPYWSIQNEVLYYLTFGLIFFSMTFMRRKHKALSIIATISIITFLSNEPINANNAILYSGFWLSGALLSIRGWFALFLNVLIYIIYIVISRYVVDLDGQLRKDIYISILMLIILSGAVFVDLPSWLKKPSAYVSDFSFSLYLFHMPAINTMVSFLIYLGLFDGSYSDSGKYGWSIIGAYFLISLLTARLAYNMFESRTYAVRRFLLKKVLPLRRQT